MNPLNRKDSYDYAIVGFEFEFYSKLPRTDIAKDLGSLLKKKIEVRKAYHSSAQKGTWKIEPDFSGGVLMHELVTPPMPFFEAMLALSRILGWMRGSCWTDEKCAFQFNVSFDKKRSKLRTPIEGVNRLKFVLGYDEQYVYDRFPKRKNSVYSRSISTLIPNNKFQVSDETSANPANYELPEDKFYGINFTKTAVGYLEFRYLGGKGYEKKPVQIREVIEYSVDFLYNTLQRNDEYTPNELARLRIAMAQHKKVAASFSDPERFLREYPSINVLCNLDGQIQTLQTFWVQIREKLFDLIVKCGMRSGIFNYDSDVGRYQLKDAYVPSASSIIGFELVDCKVRGNVVACDLWHCDIKNSHLLDCHIKHGTTVAKSKIMNSRIAHGSDVDACYVDNRDAPISGHLSNCIIRSGDITAEAELVDCELVSKLIGLTKNADGKSDAAKHAPAYWDKLSGDKKGSKTMGQVLAGYIGGSEIPVEKGSDKKTAGTPLQMPGIFLNPKKNK